MEAIFQRMGKFLFDNSANLITAIGIILTGWISAIFWWNEPAEHHLLIVLLATGVGFSDLLDGWLARRWKVATSLGGFLDKFRDKLFACSVFIYFFVELWFWTDGVLSVLVKALIVLVLVIELFLITIWIAGVIKKFDTSSHLAGKIKMTFYFIAIGWWFFLEWLGNQFKWEFKNCLYIGSIFLLSTASIYGILSVVGYVQRYGKKNN